MSSTPCPQCGRPIRRALLPDGERVVLDDELVEGGAYGSWHRQEGLHTVARARPHTRENHFGATGYQLHACPGAAGKQLEIGAA